MVERIAVQFSAVANFSSLSKQLQALNTQLAATSERYSALGATGAAGFAQISKQFDASLASLKGWEAQTVSVRSGVNRLTEDIKNQGYTIERFMVAPIDSVKKAWIEAGAVAEQQLRLQKAQYVEMSKTAMGNSVGRFIVPTGNINSFTTDAERATMRMNVFNNMLKSSATRAINWGKNMQWAGRQLTYGFSMPMLLITGLIGKMSFNLEDQQNKLRAVYGGIGKESQAALNQVSQASQDMALKVAKEFGVAGNATMQLEAQLAGMGYTGDKLQTVVYQVSRLQALAAKGTVEQSDAVSAAINLMNNFNIPVSKLEDTFNHLNAAENTTVLATNDIVTALPRAGQAIATLGGSWQDLVVLMAGMRASGIPAAQAATALNRSIGSLVSPSTTAVKLLDSMNISIQNIVDSNTKDGHTSIVGIFNDLGKALKGFSGQEQLAAINSIFSKFQGTRIITAIRGLVQQNGKIGTQMQQAADAVNSSSASAAANAQKDIENRFNTTVGTIRKSIAAIGVELSIAGEPFLATFGKVLNVVEKLISAFTHLPDIVKKMFASGLFIVALAGPITMVTGLIGVLWGSFVKLASTITGLKLGTKELETEETILSKISTTTGEAFAKQEVSAQALTDVIAELNVAMQRNVAIQEKLAASKGLGMLPPIVPKASAAMGPGVMATGQNGLMAGGTAPIIAANAAKVANETENAAASTSKFTAGLGKAVPLIATAAIGTAILASNSHGVLAEISKWALPVAIFLPLIPAMVKGFQSLITTIKGALAAQVELDAAMAAQNGEQAVGGLTSAFRLLGGAINPVVLGVTALTAAAVAGFVLWHRGAENAKKDQEALANGAEVLAGAVGVAWNDTDYIINKVGKHIQGTVDVLSSSDKILKQVESSDAGKRLVDQLSGMDTGKLVSSVKGYGLQLALGGASPKQVHDAMQALFYKAGKGGFALNASLSSIKFNNEKQLISQTTKNIEDQLNLKSNNLQIMNPYLRSQGLKQVEIYASQVGKILTQSSVTPEAKKQLVDNMLSFFTTSLQNVQDKINALTVKARTVQPGSQAARDLAGQLTALHTEYDGVSEAAKTFGTQVAETSGFTVDSHSKMGPLKQILSFLNSEMTQGASDAAGYGNAVDGAAGSVQRLSNALSQTDVTSFASDFQSALTSNIGAATSYIDQQYQNMAQAASDSVSKQQQADDHAYAQRSKAASVFYNYLASAAGKGYDIPKKAAEQYFNAQVKGSQDSAKARKAAEDLVNKYNKGSETSIKSVTDRYNKQIEAIKQKQKAEAAAQAQQNKDFAEEEKNIERIAAQENLNIDFNTAIYSGDLGKAAQDLVQAQADQAKNALDDAKQAADDKAAADKKQSDHEIALLTKTRDHKIKALKAEAAARKVWLQNELSDVTRGYDHEKTLNDKRLEAYKTGLEQSYQLQQTLLDRQMAQITATVPTTKKDMNDMFGALSTAAQGYGVNLMNDSKGWYDTVSGTWARSITSAADQVKNDNVWTKFGSDIADKTLEGIGMNWKQFTQFLKTGKLPKTPNADGSKPDSGQANGQGGHRLTKSHTGAYITGDGKFGVKPDESVRTLQHGEYVVQKPAVRKYGRGMFESLNNMTMHEGGMVNPVAEITGGLIAGAMKSFIKDAIKNAYNIKVGRFGGGLGGGLGQYAGLGGTEFVGGHFAGLDQGVDWTGKFKLLAPDAMRVTRVDTNSSWPGGTLIAGQLLSGANKNRFAYFAEAIRPAAGLHAGEILKRGGLIGSVNSSYPGSESGFAQNAYGTPYGNEMEGKNGNAPDPQAVAWARYIGLNSSGGAVTVPSLGSGSHPLTQYIPAIKTALSAAHLPTTSKYVRGVLYRMSVEDGSGIKGEVNRTDSNWAAGTPSVGLMQVTGPTFADNAGPYLHTGPFSWGVSTNATANIYAGIEHALHAYSKPFLDVMYQAGGYDNGGVWKSGTFGVNQSGKPEVVFTNAQWRTLSKIANSAVSIAGNNGKMGSSGDTYQLNFEINGANLDANDVADIAVRKLKFMNTRNNRVVTG